MIIGNPPYSVGQINANDNNKNVVYPHLDSRIRDTYSVRSKAALQRNLFDSYIRAIRWASDRIGNSGVIGFVSGSGFTEKPAMDGMRKCLAEEFTNIHIINLRGDIRKNMLSQGRAKEGQNIFGSGSMTGIAITLFVKNPNAQKHGEIFWHDIGDDLKTAEKLTRIAALESISGIDAIDGWLPIIPDEHGDWVNLRDNSFGEFITIGDKKGNGIKLFENFSLGVSTNRDAWVYNSSRSILQANMNRMISFYNSEVERFDQTYAGMGKKFREEKIDNFVNVDLTKISWTRGLKQELVKNRKFFFDDQFIKVGLYRPFTKQNLYFNRNLIEMILQMPKIFPIPQKENRVICVSGVGARSGFSALMSNVVPNLDNIEKGQNFPLYLYENISPETDEIMLDETDQSDLFLASQPAATSSQYTRKDGISDAGLSHFQAAYPREIIGKEDLFYYVYGLLHSPDYRERYADNLVKELPRIPCVKTAADFWAFSQAGRKLADLHLDYESVPCYPVEYEGGALLMAGLDDVDYRVTKMKFASKADKSRVVYNLKITMTGIPLEAYEYVVNGKPALEWVMERQAVTTHKDSGIVNDANLWATETMGNARYPLELFQRVITVSLETMKIVRALPKLAV